MNYYIQGDAANADKIKAAFEEKGYDMPWPGGCANPDVINIGVERDGAKYVVAETAEYIKVIIKNHPDYKELELPTKAKCKVGDWVVIDNCHNSVYQVDSVRNHDYILKHTHGGLMPFPFSSETRLRFWTIEDIKDGDILVTTTIRNHPFIYRKTSYKNNLAYYYAGIDGNGNFCEGCIKRTLSHFGPVADVIPATKELRDLLFAKMKEAGYEWDAEKKELRKIQPHYDVSNFHTGMPVLVREYDTCCWQWVLYSHFNGVGLFFAAGKTWRQCIPFNEKTKYLLGTTDMPSEEYINW